MAGGFHPAEGDPTNASLYSGGGTLEEAAHHLFKVTPEVNIVHLAITLLSLFVTFFGLFSGFVKERLYVGEAIIATGFGIAFSGYAAGVFAPRTWSEGHHFDEITLEFTRIIIALSVFAVGVELPKAYVLRHWKSLAMLLGPIMFLGWMVSAALMYAIIPGLEFLPALVVAAGVTPTDPILASSVVGKGKFAQEHVPAHIRHILQAESGCNDGAAFPFLYIALMLLMRDHQSIGYAIGRWFLLCLIYQIILGCIIGALVGLLARKLLKFSKRRELIDRESMVAMYVALALLVTGLTTLAGSDDLLAAFSCGTAFAWDDWFTESIEESNFSSTIDLLANCAVFLYLGATMPFAAWVNPDLTLTVWRLVLLAAGILAFRRLPTIFAFQWWIPDIKTRREALFAGHFGPMGVGAIFISTLAASKLPTPSIPPVTELDILALTVQPITYFIVLSSILIHGLTISFFTLGRRVHSRVTSFSRTLTSASRDVTMNSTTYDEPSWMSRVKRAQNREDIVVNRDDGDDPASLAEKGAGNAANGDLGMLAMFGAGSESKEESPSSGSGGSETAGSSEKEEIREEKRGREKRETEHELEMDDDPPKNILADYDTNADEGDEQHEKGDGHKADRTRLKAEGAPIGKIRSRDSAKDARYCAPNQTQTWQEGRKIIIDRNDGEDVEVIDLDASPEDARHAHAHPRREVLTIPQHVIHREMSFHDQGDSTPQEHEESAIHRVTQRWLKTGSLLTAATTALMKKDDGLTPQEREIKRKEKLKRDNWCRKEQKFRDSLDKEWMEGSKVVTEHADGTIDVRELTDKEKAARAARHVAALRALGAPASAYEDDLNKLNKLNKMNSNESDTTDSNKGKSPDRRVRRGSTGGAGLGLERTERILPDEEELGEEVPDSTPSTAITRDEVQVAGPSRSRAPRDASSSPSASPSRPNAPPRSQSAMRAMRDMFTRGGGSSSHPSSPTTEEPAEMTEEEASNNLGGAIAPVASTIRFADVDRPTREGQGSTGRPLPVVGSGLSVRRVPTQPREK